MPSPEQFAERYPFPLDDFQLEAIDALHRGDSVLVAAPTGSGKTVVAEFAVDSARDQGRKAFYTTPLKALSNQKFGDFVARYGPSDVGLLTGDNSINSEAPVVVMTTEVLRNMLYERSATLEGLAHVIMDEVHYLQDPYRGAVWEEVLIHLPPSVCVVCLSATISNAEEFGDWIGTLRGPTTVVIEEGRPVPLEHHYVVGHELLPMHASEDGHPAPNPRVLALERRQDRAGLAYRRRSHRRPGERPRGRPRGLVPRREEVVATLQKAGMLPAIYFVFSRAGCDRSVEYLMQSGLRLTTATEEEHIREFAELRAAWMEESDLETLGFYDFLEALALGVASHHAGMLPLFKETVEELFEQGLVKVVFATETLSLGINMPARTVVIEDLWKFQGERHELLTAGEYTQLTGRAGRRGIDEVGHAVVLYQPNVEFTRIAALASTRTYELTSSFRPSYNMAVNLVRNYTREQTHHLLNSSFAQYLADKDVVSMERAIERDRRELNDCREKMACDRGDFEEYWRLRTKARAIRDEARKGRERSRSDAIKASLGSLRAGDVIFVPGSRRRGLAAVVAVKDGKPLAVAEDRRERPFRLLARDFPEPPAPVARIRLPGTGRAHSPKYRRDVASALAALQFSPPKRLRGARQSRAAEEAAKLERKAESHPCHSCEDRPEHETWARLASGLEERIASADRRITSKTETLGKRFERVLGVLEDLGYVRGYSILPKGERLARIYGEGDVLVSEALEASLLEGLGPADTAALVSTLVYEPRERFVRTAQLPSAETRSGFRSLSAIWDRVRRSETDHHVDLCRDLEPGFAETVYRWANGDPLDRVLGESGMTAGDFVRNCKQLLDLLRQINDVSPDSAVRPALDAVNHGVVAYTGV